MPFVERGTEPLARARGPSSIVKMGVNGLSKAAHFVPGYKTTNKCTLEVLRQTANLLAPVRGDVTFYPRPRKKSTKKITVSSG